MLKVTFAIRGLEESPPPLLLKYIKPKLFKVLARYTLNSEPFQVFERHEV